MSSDANSIKGFHFTPTGIAGILKAHRLRVPPYQREYAWTRDEVTTLYSDYSLAKASNSDYFLGTIVTIRGSRSQPLEIVDGQQRLTTTTLLIAGIRDELQKIGMDQQVVNSVNNDYLFSFERKQNANICHLILNIDDHAFFEALVEGGTPTPSRESHHRLVEAQKVAAGYVNGFIHNLAPQDRH